MTGVLTLHGLPSSSQETKCGVLASECNSMIESCAHGECSVDNNIHFLHCLERPHDTTLAESTRVAASHTAVYETTPYVTYHSHHASALAHSRGSLFLFWMQCEKHLQVCNGSRQFCDVCSVGVDACCQSLHLVCAVLGSNCSVGKSHVAAAAAAAAAAAVAPMEELASQAAAAVACLVGLITQQPHWVTRDTHQHAPTAHSLQQRQLPQVPAHSCKLSTGYWPRCPG
jgi:hypothetical protein